MVWVAPVRAQTPGNLRPVALESSVEIGTLLPLAGRGRFRWTSRQGSYRRGRPSLSEGFDPELNSVMVPRGVVWSLTGRLVGPTVPFLRGFLAGPPVARAAGLRGNGRQRRPRVILVAHDVHDGGGMERAYAELIRALHAEVDFTVVSATLEEGLRALVCWRRVVVPRRPFVLKFLVFFVRAGFDVAKVSGDIVQTLGAIIPNRADIVAVHYCHAGFVAATGSLTSAGPRLRRVNTGVARCAAIAAERWCFQPGRVRAFAAVSTDLIQEVEAHYPGIPTYLTPNGVDPSRFRPNSDVRQLVRSEQQVGPGTCLALFVGGDWDRKGLGLAIEGVAKACADGADVVLWVVGPGDRSRFASLAKHLGVEGEVKFFGFREDTERFYQAADVFVLPSAYETFGIVCFEAASCGLPIIVPSISGAGALVGNDSAGIIVERDADSIAMALRLLAADGVRRSRLGTEARRRASAFTWSSSAAAVSDLYDQLLER